LKQGGNNHAGILVCRFVSGFVGFIGLADLRFRQDDGRRIMSAIYLVSGVVSAGLLVYLVAALLKPEWF
jgi:K+-transporting ATPase KdpF subunit